MKKVVMLVDNKNRDLPGAALIATHLKNMGIECYLQPLEAWRGCLYAFKPDMIIFNHLLGAHLVKYSQELHKMGVLVGVLPNEGIAYNKEDLEFIASKYHNNAHVDIYFCWNDVHKDAIKNAIPDRLKDTTRIETIGVPRFDFYKMTKKEKNSTRKKILICSNFVFSNFYHLDRSIADSFFAPWKERIPLFKDYWSLVELNYRSKIKLLEYLKELASKFDADYVLRPHPSEDFLFYEKWLASQDHVIKNRVVIDKTSLIWDLILDADLEIACETCTTTMESWLSNVPTIELIFDKHPLFYNEDIARLTTTCNEPSNIVETVLDIFENGEPDFIKTRKEHFLKWCHTDDGTSSLQMATIIKEVINRTEPNFSKITMQDKRRGLKLLILNKLNLPYNYNPLLSLPKRIYGIKSDTKKKVDEKTIKPLDVIKTLKECKKLLNMMEI